jgi:hypothetical protein
MAAVNAEAEDIHFAALSVPHDERAEGKTR